jgi:hypothetical protein
MEYPSSLETKALRLDGAKSCSMFWCGMISLLCCSHLFCAKSFKLWQMSYQSLLLPMVACTRVCKQVQAMQRALQRGFCDINAGYCIQIERQLCQGPQPWAIGVMLLILLLTRLKRRERHERLQAFNQ